MMRCGVIGSAPEHQAEWFDETMKYLADRYHELSQKQVSDLRVLGERFAAPTKVGATVAEDATPSAEDADDADAKDAPEDELDAVNAA